MASWNDVRAEALAMPGAVEVPSRGTPTWRTGAGRGTHMFVWERPLRRRDLDEVGEQPGGVLGVRVGDELEKRALVASEPDVFFTTSHFDGYAIVLARLAALTPARLHEVVVSAWLDAADPDRVAHYERLRRGGA